MNTGIKTHPQIKPGLHPRNKHRERYDLRALAKSFPGLKEFVHPNEYGDESIDFFNPNLDKPEPNRKESVTLAHGIINRNI